MEKAAIVTPYLTMQRVLQQPVAIKKPYTCRNLQMFLFTLQLNERNIREPFTTYVNNHRKTNMGYNNKNREGTYMSENEKPKHNNKNCAIKKGLRI